jgi:hypothetical protein
VCHTTEEFRQIAYVKVYVIAYRKLILASEWCSYNLGISLAREA